MGEGGGGGHKTNKEEDGGGGGKKKKEEVTSWEERTHGHGSTKVGCTLPKSIFF